VSLLREIQSALAGEACDMTVVLRKCKILAARLGSDELGAWVSNELDGYPDSKPVPEYRRLAIQHYASFINMAYTVPQAAVPTQIVPEEHREAFTVHEFKDGIAKAALLAGTRKSAHIQKANLVFALQGKMYPNMNCQSAWGVIGAAEFEQLVSGVKNRMLDLSLKIEVENPAAGEAQPGSQPVAPETIQTLVQTVIYGNVGNISQNSHGFTQSSK
jgi:AbiTii